MLRWLVAIEIVLIVGVFAVIAAGLRWDFSSPLPGAMVAVSELREQAEIAPSGEVTLSDATYLSRLERDNPGFWYRVIGPRNEVRSGLADGPDSVPPMKLGDEGKIMRLDEANNAAIVWSGDGQMLIGASGAVTGWADVVRFFWLEISGYVALLLLLPLLGGGLVIFASIKPIRARLTALRPPEVPDLAHGQRLSASEMPAELASFAENYNTALEYIGTAMQRLDSLSGDVAHEFRTPLNRMWVQADKLPPGSARDTIMSELRTLADTLNALLNLAKSGLEGAPHELADLTALTQSIVQGLAPAAFCAGRDISFEGNGHCQVNTNAALAGIVIRNLIENAIRHTRVNDRIAISIADCEITVADSGNGLSAAAGKSSRGLGLKLTERIAAHLNAKLTFGDTPGGGLTVTVKF
jgi:signal transduction histidine kinase